MWSSLPDVPWHIGYTKKDEDDPRRHKSRCGYNRGGKCYCPSSECYISKCGSSSHCFYYREDVTEEIVEEKVNTYTRPIKFNTNRPPMILDYTQKKEDLLKNSDQYRHMKLESFILCRVCCKKTKTWQKGVRKCPRCGMYYVKIEFEDTIQSRYKIVVNDSTAKNNEIRRIKTTSPAALDLIVDADWFDKWTTKPKHNDESQKPKQKEKKNKSKNKSKPKRGYESR